MKKKNVIEELELMVEIEETLFAKQVSADVNQQWEDFMTCTCKNCKNKYNLMKVKYADGNPICPNCSQC